MSKLTQSTLAIFAGRGDLPKMLIEECQKNKRPYILLLLEGEEYDKHLLSKKHNLIAIGQVGKTFQTLRENQVNEIIFIGKITKPSFSGLKVDSKGALLLAKILGAKLWGDDHILNIVINFCKKEGFKVVGIDEIMPNLLIKEGFLGRVKASRQFDEDIKLGFEVLNSLAAFDIGQAVVVQQKQILGIEGREGTDLLIKRCALLSFKEGRAPILVKGKKINQTTKIDLPAFGLLTVRNLKEANFAGAVLEANFCLIINQPEVKEYADLNHLFIKGVKI